MVTFDSDAENEPPPNDDIKVEDGINFIVDSRDNLSGSKDHFFYWLEEREVSNHNSSEYKGSQTELEEKLSTSGTVRDMWSYFIKYILNSDVSVSTGYLWRVTDDVGDILDIIGQYFMDLECDFLPPYSN